MDRTIRPKANPPYYAVNVGVAVISFFSFLAGLYFIAFSKERVEDEMVQRTRLDSFYFAALVQMILIICGFLAMLIFGEPDIEWFAMFFIGIILFFWLCFMDRFNYILHVKLK